jgi:hypothetical protein
MYTAAAQHNLAAIESLQQKGNKPCTAVETIEDREYAPSKCVVTRRLTERVNELSHIKFAPLARLFSVAA